MYHTFLYSMFGCKVLFMVVLMDILYLTVKHRLMNVEKIQNEDLKRPMS